MTGNHSPMIQFYYFELLSQAEGYQALTNQILCDLCSDTHVLHDFYVNIYTSTLKYLYVLRRKCLTCIPCEHKPFWKLSQLNDFSINAIVTLLVPEKLKIPDTYSELSLTSKMELFAKMVNCKKSLTISGKSSILDFHSSFTKKKIGRIFANVW